MVWIAQPPRHTGRLAGARGAVRRRPGDLSVQGPERLAPPAGSARPVVVETTRRQLECLAWVAEGKTASEIGDILGISARTVEDHLARLCAALGVRKRIQAVERAVSLGLLRSNP